MHCIGGETRLVDGIPGIVWRMSILQIVGCRIELRIALVHSRGPWDWPRTFSCMPAVMVRTLSVASFGVGFGRWWQDKCEGGDHGS